MNNRKTKNAMYYYRLLFFMILYELLYVIRITVAKDNQKVYSMPLMRQKSSLEMLIKDPSYMGILKTNKNQPINENVTLYKYMDTEYYAEINVGKPAQKFKVIFDTTWGDMWIPSIMCSKTLFPICRMKNLYDGSASSTHKSIDPIQPFNVAGLVGTLTSDTVRLAHINVSDLIFAEVTEIPNITNYEFMHADGIIGLAFNTLSKTTNIPFFYKLLADKKINKPIFSVYFNRDITTPKGGTIFLGGISKKHSKGSITYVSVIEKKYWKIEVNQLSVRVNKTNSKTFCKPTCQMILDTGTNIIGVPKDHVVEINTLIHAVKYKYNRYAVNCLQVQKLPTITFNIGGSDFRIHGRHYIQKIEDDTGTMVCLSAFYESRFSDDDVWTLGGAFLSSVYTTFELDQNRIGFSNLIKPVPPQ